MELFLHSASTSYYRYRVHPTGVCRVGMGTGQGAEAGGKHGATEEVPPATQAAQGK